MMLANLYDALNHLFGTPIAVTSETYCRTEIQFLQDTVPLLTEISEYLNPAARVLIVGCGNGVEIEWFAKKCGAVIAIDVCPLLIDQAKKRSENYENVECILVNRRTLPFHDNEFDLIFMHNVCEHIISIEEVF